MKKIFIFIFLTVFTISASAQTLNVVIGNVTYAVPASQAGEMPYTDGTTVTIMNKTFSLGDITRMYVDATPVVDNTVIVTYSDSDAKVVVAGNVAQYITPTVNGTYVSILQAENITNEITYNLTGTSVDGSFYLEGPLQANVVLDNLSLTNSTGAALDFQNSKGVCLNVVGDNNLADGSAGSQKGCFVCKSHVEIQGEGTLNLTGNTSHALYAKEYITIKETSVNILGSIKDAINCNQYLTMESGAITIVNAGDDGVQVSFKDDVDRQPEDTGSIIITGGSIEATISATAAKAVKADGNIVITAGEFDLTVTGGGKWDAEDVKTKAATCFSADGYMQIDGGKLILTATNSGGKGISCDGALTVNGGEITVVTSGGLFAYVNGVENPNYTGNTDNLESDYKSSPKGVKADGDITINGGTINVTTSGNGGEGIESKGVMTINDGTITVKAYDDGLNSSSHMYINGGDITVVATNNDAIDSNGNLYVSGGYTRAFGAGAPEGGIDANEEENYTVYFTGGKLLAVGGNSSTPRNAESTQSYVSGSGSVTANSVIKLSEDSTVLAEFIVPENYSGSSAMRPAPGGNRPGSGGGAILITCPGLTSGSSYTLTVGSTTSSVSATQYGSSGFRP